jgi:PAS domain S-box-containing protein
MTHTSDPLTVPLEALASVLADLTDYFAIYDREWRFVYVNDAAAKVLEKAREELLGQCVWELYPAAVGNEFYKTAMAVAADRRPRHLEHYSATYDRWYDNFVSPSPAGISVLAIDITARKRAELALAESEARFRDLADTAPVFIWTSDEVNHCDWFNAGWLAFTGRTLEEEIGDGWREGIHPDDRLQVIESDVQAFDSRQQFWVEYRLRRYDGAYRWMLDTGIPRFAADGTFLGYIGTTVDIHARHEAEELRRQSEERERQSTKMEAIGRLAGGLAHDLNNQLQAAIGFATFLERDQGLSAQGHHDLSEVIKSAERMRALVAQLLAFSRQQVLSPETLDINSAVIEAQSLLQRLIGPTFDLQLDLEAGRKWTRVDRTQFFQVMMNLTINARDAQPQGGRVLFRTRARELERELIDPVDGDMIPAGLYVEFQVADSGSGIPPEHLDRIFEPFFTTKAVGMGTGLGLSTVHGIVTQSKGHVTVDSKVGKGTTFTVLLPSAAGPEEQDVRTESRDSPRAGSAWVLVVEDADVVRRVIVRMLEGAGFRVLQARHGAEALQVLERQAGSISAVLTDLIMPVMNGFELTTRIQERGLPVPVVWMSGHPLESMPQAWQGAETFPLITKPVTGDQLVSLLSRILPPADLPSR